MHKGLHRCILQCNRISRNIQTFVITLWLYGYVAICDTGLFSARLPVKVFKTLNGWQSHILSKFHKIVLANLNYHMSIKTSQAILKGFIDLKSSVFQKQQTQLTRGDFFRRFSAGAVMTSNVACHAMLLTENSNERTRDQQKHYIEIPQNRLV